MFTINLTITRRRVVGLFVFASIIAMMYIFYRAESATAFTYLLMIGLAITLVGLYFGWLVFDELSGEFPDEPLNTV